MEYLKLIGIVIVIVGFALKLDSILIIFLAAVSTALVGGLGVGGLLENLGSNFVSNRSMAIFIIILLVTGTLERNGLREAAADFIRKFKNVTVGKLVCIYVRLTWASAVLPALYVRYFCLWRKAPSPRMTSLRMRTT